jgi:hypothetical protein
VAGAGLEDAEPGFEWTYIPFPGSDNAEDNQYLFGKYDQGWAIAANTPNPAGALAYLAAFSEPDNYHEFVNAVGFLPTQPTATLDTSSVQRSRPTRELPGRLRAVLGRADGCWPVGQRLARRRPGSLRSTSGRRGRARQPGAGRPRSRPRLTSPHRRVQTPATATPTRPAASGGTRTHGDRAPNPGGSPDDANSTKTTTCSAGQARRGSPVLLLFPGFFFYLLIASGRRWRPSVYSFTDATGIRGIPINWVGFDNYDEFLFEGARSRDNLDALRGR